MITGGGALLSPRSDISGALRAWLASGWRAKKERYSQDQPSSGGGQSRAWSVGWGCPSPEIERSRSPMDDRGEETGQAARRARMNGSLKQHLAAPELPTRPQQGI
ncbi:hypothetical protein TEQG_08474 [Trichophyton equinum CBS 127.97]|uniref:Uncharacterized protein n=1 Tax=Trichophyton equinum (strain ATCC MYA-4606 / CBS 127.97) TaxID=559882 RepID=F2Q5V2_TRIEC|nr:hypothetical protein TEQG_08474 [Trichophyton equinum CBS 127.97]